MHKQKQRTTKCVFNMDSDEIFCIFRLYIRVHVNYYSFQLGVDYIFQNFIKTFCIVSGCEFGDKMDCEGTTTSQCRYSNYTRRQCCQTCDFLLKRSKWAATWQNNKMSVRPAKTQISLGIRPVWSESSLSDWRNIGSLATHWAQAKTLIRLGGRPGWSESSLGAHSYCWFCQVVAQVPL